MCGIVGLISFSSESFIHKETFSKMVDALEHRGPDDKGIFIDKNIYLGHRRLSILDLSKAGQQPMKALNNNVWIIHNGEVYNFKELKGILQRKGYKFKSNTDTEVILNSYLEWGIKCIEKFRGMFAFAIYDKSKNKIFIVRDRLGIKPLYYTFYQNKFIFASEIKSILLYPGFPRDYSKYGISSYLSYRYPIKNLTMYKNIYSLEPGHYIEIDLNTKSYCIKQYWELPILRDIEDKGEDYYINNIREILNESVKYRMISDVPFGAYLSGGLDSSIVVAIMSKFSQLPIKTFTIGFEEEGFNEFSYAEQVAKMYNTEHYEILLRGENYIYEMINLIEYKDAPLGVANEPALYVMSRELKKYITVVLSGEGSDEIFGGYGRIFRSPFDYERIKLIQSFPELGNEYIVQYLKNNLSNKYGNRLFKDEVEFFLYLYQYIRWEDKLKFLSNDFINSLKEDNYLNNIFYEEFEKIKELDIYRKFMWIFEKFHIVGLLHRVDTTTMATSVEARVPFVDHKLVEFSMGIPVRYKLKWKSNLHKIVASIYNADQISEIYDIPKYILKKSYNKDLPNSVVWRKKMGFPVPVHTWFGNKFKNFSKEILLSKETKERGIYNIKNIEKLINSNELENNHKLGLKLWMILNLEIWFRKYIDKLETKWSK